MEGICRSKKCRRTIFDTENLDELQSKIECQHCHHVNTIKNEAGKFVYRRPS